MNKKRLTEKAKSHLHVLCAEIGERRVGSKENRMATAYAKQVLEELGWQTQSAELPVIDWKTGGATSTCNGQSFEVFSSHYSLGCSVSGKLVAINSVAQLEKTDYRIGYFQWRRLLRCAGASEVYRTKCRTVWRYSTEYQYRWSRI